MFHVARPGLRVLEKKHPVLDPELGLEMLGGALAEPTGWKGFTHWNQQFTIDPPNPSQHRQSSGSTTHRHLYTHTHTHTPF